jgi:hypothetical protein
MVQAEFLPRRAPESVPITTSDVEEREGAGDVRADEIVGRSIERSTWVSAAKCITASGS